MQNLDDLDKEGKVTSAKTTAQGPDLSSLEAKMDQMLKYQRTVRGIAIFRGIISFLFFLVFIVLPIVGGVYFFKYIRTSGLIDQISGQYTDFYQTLDSLKDTAGQVGNLGDMLDGITE
ncbi:hypothetical protein JW752_01505 [Candidatus Peregrinibacteria bacterium]|nr:hypothetical protein [Candidatus Peregrinibacteria bacterium]